MKNLIIVLAAALALTFCGPKKGGAAGESSKGYAKNYTEVKDKPAKAGTKLTTIDDGEEVTVLETVNDQDPAPAKGEKKITQYLKVQTVDNKTGFVPKDAIATEIYVAVSETPIKVHAKNTPTATIKGTLYKGAMCYVEETIKEWAKGNCYSAKYEAGEKPKDYFNVWFIAGQTGLVKDPGVFQSASLIRKAFKVLLGPATEGEDDATREKKMAQAQERLQQAIDLNTSLSALAAKMKKATETSDITSFYEEQQGDEPGVENGPEN